MSATRREPLPNAFKLCLLLSAILHVGLIAYGSYQDARSAVKYTDVDYAVFSDAARFVWAGLASDGSAADRPDRTVGPLGGWLGSPYDRATYRYTPLLALVLTPNEAVHPAFGKVLFTACDLVVGYLLFLLFPTGLDGLSATKWVAGLWLLNPLPLNIATRGSSESVLGALLLLSLYYFCRTPRSKGAGGDTLSRSEIVGSILLGLAVHVKIYPVVFAFSLLGYFGRSSSSFLGRLGLTTKGVAFGLVSGGTFVGITALCYAVWGYEAVHHPYLYHLTRLDHRHNFSPYFYPIYLQSAPAADAQTTVLQTVLRSPLSSFVPQLGLASLLAWSYGRRGELPMAWAVSTAVFVAFNKVVTSQYFIWYLSLLPLVLPRMQLGRRRAILLTSAWVLAQALWLSQAYNLEFLGESVFGRVWTASIGFLAVNAWVLGEVIGGFQ